MNVDRYALFGHPVALSLSPRIHQQFAQSLGETIIYNKEVVFPEHFSLAVCNFFEKGGSGLNITVPHKESAYRLADKVSEDAAIAAAANTLWIKDNKIHADNTDGRGFIQDLSRQKIKLKNKTIMILGAGGAVRGILAPLLKQNPKQLFIVNRTLKKVEQLVEDFSNLGKISALSMEEIHRQPIDLLINGISLHQIPIDKINLKPRANYYDLKYSKAAEASLLWAEEQGFNKISDGWGMLVSQAAESYKIWRGKMPDITEVLKWNDK